MQVLKKFLDDDSNMQALSLTARALREEEERREERRALEQVGIGQMGIGDGNTSKLAWMLMRFTGV